MFELLFLILPIVAPIVLYEIYNSQTHIKCKDEQLRENARVISIDTKTVGLKGTRKYRTTVVFSDGFEYISHMTGRDDEFSRYTIFLTPGMKKAIIADAKAAHFQRLRKYQNKKGITGFNATDTTKKDFAEISKPVTIIKTKQEENSTISDEPKWICPLCKRRNLSTASRCWNCASIKE